MAALNVAQRFRWNACFAGNLVEAALIGLKPGQGNIKNVSHSVKIGDLSPVVKRNIAPPMKDNIFANEKSTAREGILATEGPRLKEIVHILAANVNRLITREKARGGVLVSNAKINEITGLSTDTIGRMRRGDGSATVGSVARIARAFGLKPFELLFPGLDADARPELVSDPQERELLRAFRGKPPTQH